MMVVTISMWPGGSPERARVLSVGTFGLLGQATRDDATLGVKAGERGYTVRLYRDVAFGGPEVPLPGAPTWRTGFVWGHRPGLRGTWDLVAAGLNVLLERRVESYRGQTEGLPTELPLVGTHWQDEGGVYRVVDHVEAVGPVSLTGSFATSPRKRAALAVVVSAPADVGQVRLLTPSQVARMSRYTGMAITPDVRDPFLATPEEVAWIHRALEFV